MIEPKDQVQAEGGEEQSKEKLSMHELIDKGFEEAELLTAEENKAKGKPTEEPKAKDTEPPPAAKPFRVLKVGGKDVPVATEEELNALAMKGLDYTRKTQALADDRRSAEAELKTKAEGLEGYAARMTELLDRLVEKGILPEKVAASKKASAAAAGEEAETVDKVTEEDAAIFKEFQIDPANAYPHEKNMARTIHELRRDVQEILLERKQAIVDNAIAEERDNFPYEDVKDDQGVNLTQKQLQTIVLEKRRSSGIANPTVEDVAKWGREAVREIHDFQRKSNGGGISDDMDPEEFAKKFPKLAKSLKGPAAGEGAENGEAKPKLPPSMKPAPRPSDLTRKPKAGAGERKSLQDFLDDGFKDPDTIKALNEFGG